MTTAITAARPEEACASAQDSASAWGSTPVSSVARAAGPGPGLASPSAACGAGVPGPFGSAEADRRLHRALTALGEEQPVDPEPEEAACAAPGPGFGGTSRDRRARRPGDLWAEEDGLATAEYGIVMLAAVGFAGLLVAVLSSGEVQEMLHGIVEQALSL